MVVVVGDWWWWGTGVKVEGCEGIVKFVDDWVKEDRESAKWCL